MNTPLQELRERLNDAQRVLLGLPALDEARRKHERRKERYRKKSFSPKATVPQTVTPEKDGTQ